jgi:hypothetical protein
MMRQGSVLALTGRASDAIEILISGITALQTTAATFWIPFHLPHLARAHAELGQFEEAWRCIGEATIAVETTKEKWCEAEVHRTAGEIALMSPEPDAAKAQAHLERAIAIARAQKAKSWELHAATSLARLWRDHGKRQQARDLLAPVYGWFTEGFDTADLKEAALSSPSCGDWPFIARSEATKQSQHVGHEHARDCFAEPVLGPASGRTRGLAMTTWKWRFRCDNDDHKIALLTRYISTLAAVVVELRHRAHPRGKNECVYKAHV